MSITLQVDARKVRAMLGNARVEQIPFATSQAINKTGLLIRTAEIAEMQRVFDRPTRYTLNSLRLEGSTKRTLSAKVWFKQQGPGLAPHYLLPQVEGGTRPQKAFEKRLTQAGYLPSGWYVVPGKGARLDGSGNMSRGQINQVLSVLHAQFDPYANTTTRSKQRARKKPRDFFASTPSNPAMGKNGTLPYGVWEHTGKWAQKGSRIKAVMMFVPRVHYRRRFDFYGVATRTWESRFETEFKDALSVAMASAR